MKKTNNKGFSLVELIVVIAIMAVLIGVLAPTFTKYVEQSRRSTDIQNAEQIRTAIIADMTEGVVTTYDTAVSSPANVSGYKPSSINDLPKIQANFAKGNEFQVTFDKVTGVCAVYAGGYELTKASEAATYKTATAAK